MKYKKLVLFSILLLVTNYAFPDVPKPENFLGFKIGTDRKLANMHQIIDYFNMLAEANDRVVVQEIGKTTEKNPFIVAIITSKENQKNLDKYREYQQLLADPRRISDEEADEIISKGKTVVMINCSLHASEIGASQMSLNLAYDLATKTDPTTQEILDNVILLLLPMHNPDGIKMVVDWYNKYVGTKFEACRMPWLYQKYVGHDNNRDWYMFTQVETRLTLQVHNAWHPQIVVDMHQMGSRGARLFVPPFIDPYEPNVDPIIRQQVAMMGTFIAAELTAEGKAGVMHSERFDAWTPARAYHHYHGGIRILTECASARTATPIKIEFDRLSNSVKSPSVKMVMPWQGGDWTLKDIVDYDYSAAKAALTNGARLRENWLRNFYRIHKKAVNRTEPPFAFVIPKNQRDLSTAIKMMKTLQLGDVEIHKANMDFKANGKQYLKGDYIIYMAQPYGGFAKALLENQQYPEIRSYPGGPLKTPYDVVAHTLPLLMGVKVIQVDNKFEVTATKLESINQPGGQVHFVENIFGYAWSHRTNDDIVALNRLVNKNHKVYWAAENFETGKESFSAGTMIVKNDTSLEKSLSSIVKNLLVDFRPIKKKPNINGYEIKPVRLGLYKSWTASMDEGWTRWVLEQYEFQFKSVFNEDLKKENILNRLDVLLLPDIGEQTIVKGRSKRVTPPGYAGGIGEKGVENIREFVNNGGVLITLNNGAAFPIKHFKLAIEDSSRKINRKEFFIPGSILSADVNNRHPLAYGYAKEEAIFFRRSPAFQVSQGNTVVSYPGRNPLLSGWINGEKHLFNKSAIVDIQVGKGRIILIGFPALYRAQSHNTFRFLFNAIYYGPALLKDL